MPPVGFRHTVIETLKAKPDTTPGIIKRTGILQGTLKRWLRLLRESGEIHIVGWRRILHEGRGGKILPIYAYGHGEDVPCNVKPMARATYYRRYRRRNKILREEAKAIRAEALAMADRVAKRGDYMLMLTAGKRV